MSKLSASHLFDAMRSFASGPVVGPWGRAAPLSVERLATLLAGDSPTRAAQLTPSDVARALRQTFDIERDRIVADPSFLLDLPTVPAGRRLRIDSAHPLNAGSDENRDSEHQPEPGTAAADAACSTAADLATALGVVQAREVLQGSNWIVAVVNARSELSPACEQQLALLGRQRRVLLVWCELHDANGPETQASNDLMFEGMLAHCGLAHLGPLSGLSGEELTTVFEALKRFGQACLVRVRVRHDDESVRSRTSTSGVLSARRSRVPLATRADTETDRASYQALTSNVSVAAIEAALGKLTAAEPGAVVVDLRAEAARRQLSGQLVHRYFTATQEDLYLWQWCAGLVAGGCRPVFLASQVDWFSAAAALATLPDGIDLRATIVVLGKHSQAPRPNGQPIAFMREALVCAAGDLNDFERSLSYSFAQDGLTLIWAPVKGRHINSRGHMRFDPAQSPWLERQHLAGRAERRRILRKRFSVELAPWIAAYEQVGQRSGFIWKWCLHGVELTTLSCVPAALRADVCDTKVLMGMFNVLVDDVGDRQANADLLAAFRALVHRGHAEFARFSGIERRYGEFTRDVWLEIWRRAKRYPCYDPYAPLLEFDLIQLFNTVHYSQLVNSNPYILNVVEHDDYSPQGMGLQSFAMIDLMCSPAFVANELGKLREAMWHAQWMARIGNLITTWQREMADRDYTSGVFAHALARHDLTVDELVSGSRTQIADAIYRGGHEAWFLRRWRQHRARLRRLFNDVRSVDLHTMVRGLERLLRTELVSRGEK